MNDPLSNEFPNVPRLVTMDAEAFNAFVAKVRAIRASRTLSLVEAKAKRKSTKKKKEDAAAAVEPSVEPPIL